MGDIVPSGMYKSDHSGFRATHSQPAPAKRSYVVKTAFRSYTEQSQPRGTTAKIKTDQSLIRGMERGQLPGLWNKNRTPSQASQRFSRLSSAPNPQSDADQLEAAADQAIAACGGDAREDNYGDRPGSRMALVSGFVVGESQLSALSPQLRTPKVPRSSMAHAR